VLSLSAPGHGGETVRIFLGDDAAGLDPPLLRGYESSYESSVYSPLFRYDNIRKTKRNGYLIRPGMHRRLSLDCVNLANILGYAHTPIINALPKALSY